MIVFIVFVFIYLLVVYTSNLSAQLGKAEQLNQQLLSNPALTDGDADHHRLWGGWRRFRHQMPDFARTSALTPSDAPGSEAANNYHNRYNH